MQVKHDRKLLIAIGRSRKASQWQNKEMLWSEFLDKLATTTRTRETITDYVAMSKADRDTIKDVGGFVGGYLKNGKRNNASVVNRCMDSRLIGKATPQRQRLSSSRIWLHSLKKSARALRTMVPSWRAQHSLTILLNLQTQARSNQASIYFT